MPECSCRGTNPNCCKCRGTGYVSRGKQSQIETYTYAPAVQHTSRTTLPSPSPTYQTLQKPKKDVIRLSSKKTKPGKQFNLQKKTKPTREEKLHNIHRTMEELIVIPGSTRWNTKGPEYQRRLLAQIRNTLNSLLKLDPSANSAPVSIEAKRLLKKYGYTDSVKQSP